MPLFSPAAIPLPMVIGIDAMATVLGQAVQLARIRIASADSPILRLTAQRDHAIRETELLRRKAAVGRWGL